MGIELDQMVSAKEFQHELSKYLAQTRAGQGPIGVTEGEQVVGVFLSVHDYEAAYGAAIGRMLRHRIRAGGPTYSAAQVLAHVKSRIRKTHKAKQ
jgi:hypothetical protein